MNHCGACLQVKAMSGCSYMNHYVWCLQVKAMSAVDDDATLTQLAAAWLGLHQVGHLFCGHSVVCSGCY